jgi:phosphopantetheine adenylyltransferase
MAKLKSVSEMSFIRTLIAKDKNGKVETSFIAQPYVTSMYVIIDNDPAKQICIPHKRYSKWVKDSIKRMEINELIVETTKSLLIDYISVEDITEYIL